MASHSRQGEAIPLIDFMGNLGIQLLLPKNTITYSNKVTASTIDLIFSTEQLATQKLQCQIYPIHHGLDHEAIETRFHFDTIKEFEPMPRRLFKSAPWEKICNQISVDLGENQLATLASTDLDRCVAQLMAIVQKAIENHVPIAKPSQYAKRWWSKDLTTLRKNYTRLRNQVARLRRQGNKFLSVFKEAYNAKKNLFS